MLIVGVGVQVVLEVRRNYRFKSEIVMVYDREWGLGGVIKKAEISEIVVGGAGFWGL